MVNSLRVLFLVCRGPLGSPVRRTCGGICSLSFRPWLPCTFLGVKMCWKHPLAKAHFGQARVIVQVRWAAHVLSLFGRHFHGSEQRTIKLNNFQGGPGTEPEPENGTVGTVFPGTERGTGTAGTVFQEPKPEPEPSFPVKLYWSTDKPFLQRNRQNWKPEPLDPFHPQTVTEPNRGLPEFLGSSPINPPPPCPWTPLEPLKFLNVRPLGCPPPS